MLFQVKNTLSKYRFLIGSIVTAVAIAAVSYLGLQRAHQRTWNVVDSQGMPVQDAVRVNKLNAVINGFPLWRHDIRPGSSLVVFSYEGASVQIPDTNRIDYDVSVLLLGDNGQWMTEPLNGNHRGNWNALVWGPQDERACQFVYQRWGYAPLTIRLPDKVDCIIDVGELRPVPMPTFSQQIRLVGEDGNPIDVRGSVSLTMYNNGFLGHTATLEHGIATIPGVFAGDFLISSNDMPGYVFTPGKLNRTDITTISGEPLDVTVISTKELATFAKPTWMTDFPAAVASGAQTGKPLLLDFTGSDWCGWCKALHEEVFDTPGFAAWAQKNVILVEVDFPEKTPLEATVKQQNEALAKRFKVGSYPTIMLLDPTGTKVLGKMGYQKGGSRSWTKKADAIIAQGGK